MPIPGVIASSVNTGTPVIKFGAIFPQENNTQSVLGCRNLGISYARMSMDLPSIGGVSGKWDAYTQATPKINVLLNITLHTGVSHPYPFLTTQGQLDQYALDIERLFTIYGNPEIAVFENEVLNVGYYGGAPIEDYIAMLHTAAVVCHARGIPCADGSVPLESVASAGANSDQMKLWQATAADSNITYSNLHLSQPGVTVTDITNAANKVRLNNGNKPVIGNEWVMLSGAVGNSAKAPFTDMEKTVNAVIGAGFLYSIYYDGGWPEDPTERGQSIAVNGVLNTLGDEYKRVISPYLQ